MYGTTSGYILLVYWSWMKTRYPVLPFLILMFTAMILMWYVVYQYSNENTTSQLGEALNPTPLLKRLFCSPRKSYPVEVYHDESDDSEEEKQEIKPKIVKKKTPLKRKKAKGLWQTVDPPVWANITGEVITPRGAVYDVEEQPRVDGVQFSKDLDKFDTLSFSKVPDFDDHVVETGHLGYKRLGASILASASPSPSKRERETAAKGKGKDVEKIIFMSSGLSLSSSKGNLRTSRFGGGGSIGGSIRSNAGEFASASSIRSGDGDSITTKATHDPLFRLRKGNSPQDLLNNSSTVLNKGLYSHSLQAGPGSILSVDDDAASAMSTLMILEEMDLDDQSVSSYVTWKGKGVEGQEQRQQEEERHRHRHAVMARGGGGGRGDSSSTPTLTAAAPAHAETEAEADRKYNKEVEEEKRRSAHRSQRRNSNFSSNSSISSTGTKYSVAGQESKGSHFVTGDHQHMPSKSMPSKAIGLPHWASRASPNKQAPFPTMDGSGSGSGNGAGARSYIHASEEKEGDGAVEEGGGGGGGGIGRHRLSPLDRGGHAHRPGGRGALAFAGEGHSPHSPSRTITLGHPLAPALDDVSVISEGDLSHDLSHYTISSHRSGRGMRSKEKRHREGRTMN